MKIEKTIEFTLMINEPQGHGIIYSSDIETDIASLLMSAQILQSALNSNKELKKGLKGTDKELVSKNIYHLSNGLKSVNSLIKSLCDNYEAYKEMSSKRAAHVENLENESANLKAEQLTQDGILPKEN